MKDLSPKTIVIISLTIFVFSLTQTALLCNDFNGARTYSSISMFLMGAICLLGGGLLEWIVWLANPIYFISIMFFLRANSKAKLFSIISSVLAFSFLFWKELLAAENGRTASIETFKLGYYLWLMSFIVLTAGIIIHFKKQAKELQTTNS
jgi:hypothetical protein